MSSLKIVKQSNKVWQHIDSVLGSLIVSKFFFVTENNKFQLVSKGKTLYNSYDIPSGVQVIDETDIGTIETFSSALSLSLRLEALGYPAFLFEGQIGTISGLIEAGANVTITGLGTEDSPYVISSSGGSFTPSDYDLNQFTNESADPFVRESELPSGNFIPLTGTEVGSPVTGDIEMIESTGIFSNFEGLSISKLLFEAGELFLSSFSLPYNYSTLINISPSQISINIDNPQNKGLRGSALFNKQNDPNVFAQLGDIATTNLTATPLTVVTLNSTYPTQPTGFMVICPNIATIYVKTSLNTWYTVTSGGGSTNLSNTPSPTGIDVNSSTGTGTTLPLADGTNAGLLSPSEKLAITHSNRSILDAITESFTTALKTAYDGAVTWVSNASANIRATVLTGLSTASATAITASDTVLSACGKLQAQINTLPLIIADATPSALVTTSGVSTIVKTYNIGSLNGRRILKFNVRVVRTLTGANARVTVSLRDTVTNTVVTVNLAQTLNTARTIFNLRREIPLDQTAGVMRIMPFSTNTDDGEFTTPLTNQAINFTNPLELRVELLDSSASVSIQTYQTLIELI